MAASQKINRAALDIFILLVLFYAPAFGISLCRIAADALRFSAADIAQALATKASRSLFAEEETFDLSVSVTDFSRAAHVMV
jgi:Tfp pilus assembly protein PilX